MDQDDVPPPQIAPEEPTFADSLGQVAGSMVWIVLLFAVAGALVWLAFRYLH